MNDKNENTYTPVSPLLSAYFGDKDKYGHKLHQMQQLPT